MVSKNRVFFHEERPKFFKFKTKKTCFWAQKGDRSKGGCLCPRMIQSRSVEPSQTLPSTVKIGQSLGRYKILEKIGAGGMGEVYLARDERLERAVAIKVLSPSMKTDDFSRK